MPAADDRGVRRIAAANARDRETVPADDAERPADGGHRGLGGVHVPGGRGAEAITAGRSGRTAARAADRRGAAVARIVRRARADLRLTSLRSASELIVL